MSGASLPGPLEGLRVIELASESAPFAGKMLADMGAEVVLVEPPGGHDTRAFGPFAGDEPGPERSLWFWHYNTSKRGVVVDITTDAGADLFKGLVATADVVLEAEPPGRLAELGLDHTDLRPGRPSLVWVSVTPFGRTNSRAHEEATDLTVLAAGGPVWNCGYDDHAIPPIRGDGNQGYQTASLWAVEGLLAALVWRDHSGEGQHLDVSMHAAANVTTEAGSYEWLVARATVQRQTGRHASTFPSLPTHTLAADGRYVNSGVPPRTAKEFRALLDLLDELGLREELPEAIFLEMGIERGEIGFGDIMRDPEVMEIFGAGRKAVIMVAEHLPAQEFFVRMQTAGIACGPIASPEEVLLDEHWVARGFPVEVDYGDGLGTVVHAGAPFRSTAWEYRLTRAPHIGEHDDEVLGPLRAGDGAAR